MMIFFAVFGLLALVLWFLVIYATVKFYRNYKKNKLVFTGDDLDSTESL